MTSFFLAQKETPTAGQGMRFQIIQVPAEKELATVVSQPYNRGTLIVAQDVRKDYLLISQSMTGVATCIEQVIGQPVSATSLYESARREIRCGLTHGTWSLLRLDPDAAVRLWNSIGAQYRKRIIVARRPDDWKLIPAKAEATRSECVATTCL